MIHDVDPMLLQLCSLLKSHEHRYSKVFQYGKESTTENTDGILGAFVRRRCVMSNSEQWSFEYDVTGSIPLKTADSIGLDIEALEDEVCEVCPEAFFSFEVELARVNPTVYSLYGEPRKVFPSDKKPMIVVLWASWSNQSLRVLEFSSTWAASRSPNIGFAAVSIDDEIAILRDAIRKDLISNVQNEQIRWSGCGLNGLWTSSEISRGYCVSSCPCVMLLNSRGKLIHVSMFMDDEEYFTNPIELEEILLEEFECIDNKYTSCILDAVPGKHMAHPCTWHSPQALEEFQSELEKRVSSCNGTVRVSVIVDQRWSSFPKLVTDAVTFSVRHEADPITDDAFNTLINWLEGYGTIIIDKGGQS